MSEEKAYQHERDRIFCGEEPKYCSKKVIMNLLFQELSDVLLCTSESAYKKHISAFESILYRYFPEKDRRELNRAFKNDRLEITSTHLC